MQRDPDDAVHSVWHGLLRVTAAAAAGGIPGRFIVRRNVATAPAIVGERRAPPEQYWQFAPGIEKWCAPIASVAALTAQPLAALPPYGCGVPLAGIERLVREYSTAGGRWCTAAFPDVSLRGAKRRGNLGKALTFSPELPCYPALYCEIATSAFGLLAMTNL